MIVEFIYQPHLRYAGCVFGGGYVDAYQWIDATDILGGSNVYIYKDANVQRDVYGGASYARCSGGSKVYVSGTVQGDVYGGGRIGDIHGDSVIVLKDQAKVCNVYGTGNAFSTYYNGGTLLEKGPVVTETTGNVMSYEHLYTIHI